MGSSAKKKKEKKKDFQKAKLKVGKTKPKASNFTDTSFKAKSIVLTQQSIAVNAPSESAQFDHHLSLLTHKSDSQKRESLAHLTTAITSRSVGSPLPQPAAVIVPKVKHLICDASTGVRTQLLKLLQALPESEIAGHENELLLWIRAGMTHMVVDIRLSALDFLAWLLHVAGPETVSGPGAWFKTVKCFLTLLKWGTESANPQPAKSGASSKGWSTTRVSEPVGDSRNVSKTIQVFASFLWIGLEPPDEHHIRAERQALAQAWFPLTHTWNHMIPAKPNAYAHLHLFGPIPDEDNAMLEGRDERQEVFAERFKAAVENGLEWARKEQGEVGRAAKVLDKAIRDGMNDYEG